MPESGGAVHGLMWEISAPALETLDRYEGVAAGFYRRATVEPRGPSGSLISALVYIGADSETGMPRRGFRCNRYRLWRR